MGRPLRIEELSNKKALAEEDLDTASRQRAKIPRLGSKAV